jgi:hypothetical protein
MLHRLFTGYSTRYAQALKALDTKIELVIALHKEADALRKRVLRLETDLKDLSDLHNALDSRHQKLSGQFHGARGGRGHRSEANGDGVSAIPLGDKDALRAAVGLRAGVRYNHTEK